MLVGVEAVRLVLAGWCGGWKASDRLDKDGEDARNATVMDLWMRCFSSGEIGEA
jgi:hypothetical protein